MGSPARAAEGSGSIKSLPPAANVRIDFDRDILPIFEQSCFRCHGAERPKSGFRLDDRAAALKGGRNNGDDIVPGESERSKLVQYVAQLDDDMIMPPPDKADALTAEQVGLLRAWIDQGARWGVNSVLPESSASVSTRLGWIGVQGDQGNFRELTGLREGVAGGVEAFLIEQRLNPDETVAAEGRLLFPEEDLRLKLNWTKKDFGFVRAGFEKWRRYYDDSGGFYEALPRQQFDLNRELFLDFGRAWLELGLTLPDRPAIVLGYELQFRDGTKSMLEWGNVNGRAIYPAAKDVDEKVHIVKLDIAHEWNGWRVEDNARVEFHRLRTRDRQITFFTTGPQPDGFVHTREGYDALSGANTLRVEKQLADWWLWSGGYLYSRMTGDSQLDQATVNASDDLIFGTQWNNQVTLRREMHVVSMASLFQPAAGLSVSAGAQGQFARQEGFGRINLDLGDPTDLNLFFPQPGRVRSDLDQTKASEHVGLRFDRIPFTILFAEARLEQDAIGQFERETGSTPDVFLRDTDYENDRRELRAGFSLSPWHWAALTTHYKYRGSDSDYDHRRDESLADGLGYSAFIRERRIESDEFEGKLVLHPAAWVKTTLTYRRTDSDYFTRTDPVQDPFFGEVSPGGRRRAGTYRADTFGVNLAVAPLRRLQLSGTFLYSDSSTRTIDGEVAAGAAYRGESYSVIGSLSWAIDDRTSLVNSYAFTRSVFAQGNAASGLPLGLDFVQHRLSSGLKRQLSKSVAADLRYSFFQYEESSSRGLNDFSAHGVFVGMTVRWP